MTSWGRFSVAEKDLLLPSSLRFGVGVLGFRSLDSWSFGSGTDKGEWPAGADKVLLNLSCWRTLFSFLMREGDMSSGAASGAWRGEVGRMFVSCIVSSDTSAEERVLPLIKQDIWLSTPFFCFFGFLFVPSLLVSLAVSLGGFVVSSCVCGVNDFPSLASLVSVLDTEAFRSNLASSLLFSFSFSFSLTLSSTFPLPFFLLLSFFADFPFEMTSHATHFDSFAFWTSPFSFGTSVGLLKGLWPFTKYPLPVW